MNNQFLTKEQLAKEMFNNSYDKLSKKLKELVDIEYKFQTEVLL